MSFQPTPRWPYTLNWDSPQAQGLMAWFPLISGARRDFLSGAAVTYTGSAVTEVGSTSGAGLRAFNSGSLTGGIISTLLPRWQVVKPATLVWRGTVWSSGTITNNPYLFGIANNNTNSSPFSSIAIARPNGSANKIDLFWNNSGTFASYDLDVNLSFYYATEITIVGVFDSTVRIYVNGIEKGNTGSGVSGTIQYDGTAALLFNRHITQSSNTCDTLTIDARIYNRALSAPEVAQLSEDRYWDLYYEVGKRSTFIPSTFAPSRSQAIILG